MEIQVLQILQLYSPCVLPLCEQQECEVGHGRPRPEECVHGVWSADAELAREQTA